MRNLVEGVWLDRLEFEYCNTFDALFENARSNTKIVCAPQVKIGQYRVDFLFASNVGNTERLCTVAVECDGHEFHEKTKEQAARDKARDRELTAAGIKVFRYTGSEIWRNPGRCADEVLLFLCAEWRDSRDRHQQRIVKEFGSMEAYLKHKSEGA